ncbi:MAG: GIY-YIG nuclease family protein [Pseudomonadota bacterium]
MNQKTYYVYIMTNEYNTVLYTGVTNDIHRRVYEHKNLLIRGFTSKYSIKKLVFFEQTNDIEVAITREKQVKAGPRKKKITLIEEKNPDWNDLSEGWF